MQLFGIPTCPYCRKRVNVIRAWSLKKHGEYRCPRCKGISNIYLSPLTYVFAVMAMAAGFLIYFFAKFISDNIDLMTVLKVFLPFAVFFVLTPFLVYLKKPVVRRVRKTKDGRFFDEDGNEMVMRLGKLVPTGKRDIRFARNQEQPRQAPKITNSDDMIDIAPARPAPRPQPIQPVVHETQTDDDMKIRIGKVVSERSTGRANVPNSGFEDILQERTMELNLPKKDETPVQAVQPDDEADLNSEFEEI